MCLCTCGCGCAPVLFAHGVQRRCTGCRPQGSRPQDLRHVPWILWAARTEGEYSCRCPRAAVPKTHIDTNTHTLARAPTRTRARARTYAVANARRDPRRRTHVCVYTCFYRTQPATSIRSVIADELWLGNAAEDLFDAVVEHLEGPRVSLLCLEYPRTQRTRTYPKFPACRKELLGGCGPRSTVVQAATTALQLATDEVS